MPSRVGGVCLWLAREAEHHEGADGSTQGPRGEGAVILLLALVVIAAHETAHLLLLLRCGAHPFPVARAYGLRGIGWGFRPAGIDPLALRVQWVAGPLVGLAGWLTCAAVVPWARPMFLLLAVVEVAGNSLPGGDLSRAVRFGRA